MRNAIWSGGLAPGTALREAHLAKQLNVSQVPVREALLRLENLGLVVRVPDRGTTVTKLTRTEVADMLQVRRYLEDLAFRLAVKKFTAGTAKELKVHLQRMQELVKQKDHFGVAEEDFSFHKTVWRASGNQALVATLEHLCTALYAFVSLKRHAAGEAMSLAVKAHTQLLKGLQSDDEEVASQAIQQHLSSSDAFPDFIGEE